MVAAETNLSETYWGPRPLLQRFYYRLREGIRPTAWSNGSGCAREVGLASKPSGTGTERGERADVGKLLEGSHHFHDRAGFGHGPIRKGGAIEKFRGHFFV